MRLRWLAILATALLFAPLAAESQDTPLTVAAGKGDVAAVRALLAKGAPVDGPGPQGATPLMIAAEGGRTQIVATLLDAGADVKASRGGGITALHHASAMNRTEVIDQLLAAGADIDAAGPSGLTPLLGALRSKAFTAAEHLIDKGASLRATKLGGAGLETALAMPRDDYTLAEPPLISEGLAVRLIEQGADLSQTSKDGSTILHRAAAARQVHVIPLLVKGGVNPEARSLDGQTALLRAVKPGRMELLLGGTSLITGGDPRVVRKRTMAKGTLSHSPAELRATLFDIAQRRRTTVAALLAAGADPNTRDNENVTPLHDLASLGDVETLKLLLSVGADPNVVRNEGFSPLMLAASNAHPGAITALIDGGANVDLRNSVGETALMRACIGGGDTATVAAVLSFGAEINAVNNDGLTPLLYALGGQNNVLLDRASNNPEIEGVVGLLLAAGADPNHRGKAGKGADDFLKEPKYAPARKLIQKARQSRS